MMSCFVERLHWPNANHQKGYKEIFGSALEDWNRDHSDIKEENATDGLNK